MNLSRGWVITIGALTVLPILYMVGFVVAMFGTFFLATLASEPGNSGFPMAFALLFLIHLSVMLLVFLLIAFYIVHLFRTAVVAADKKALWAVVLFLGNMFAMPVYWYLYLWRPLRERPANSAGPAAPDPV